MFAPSAHMPAIIFGLDLRAGYASLTSGGSAQYTASDFRPHYTADDWRGHWTASDTRAHYTADDFRSHWTADDTRPHYRGHG